MLLFHKATHMSSSGDMKISLKLMTWKESILDSHCESTLLSRFHDAGALRASILGMCA